MPSLSPSSVPVTEQSSISRYQSALLRARRETSNPSTIPARPNATSVINRPNPERFAALAPDIPQSSSMTVT
jgi:tRNA isopentenyl-2-thiomethyl-A-37 hydroxylase MiaE